MKKTLIIMACLLLASNMAQAQMASCAGTIKTGANGTQYCMSRQGLTWFNAMVWCKTQKLRPFELADCNLTNGVCTQLNGKTGGHIWTANVPNTSQAFYVQSNGTVSSGNRNGCGSVV